MKDYDVIIIGGGAAGLNAALILARARRSILVIDEGRPRNYASQHMHGFLSREGINPTKFLEESRAELLPYGVNVVQDKATCVTAVTVTLNSKNKSEFEVTTKTEKVFRARKLLFACGVVDILPPIEGIETFYGKGVYHCPYCDGWEYTGKKLIAFGEGDKALGLALALRTWSETVSACCEEEKLDPEKRTQAEKNGINIIDRKVIKFQGAHKLEAVILNDGSKVECDALFFNTEKIVRSDLPKDLGCDGSESEIDTTKKQHTTVPGVFLAGDAAGGVQFVIVAAAEGATAAVAINREMQDEDRA